MVCVDMFYDTRSPLILIHGKMTAQRYIHDILQPHVLPLMTVLPGAIFQQDNSQPHTEWMPQDCLHHTLPPFPGLLDPKICHQLSIS
ncbi:transposable element Tcb2 transposase [Trichonephila clavipes]|nr:transposable element Tcb2 transposase [Trichonephila clavipes]